MDERPPKQRPARRPDRAEAEARDARLKAALKANIARRKDQGRARATGSGEAGAQDHTQADGDGGDD